MHISKLGFIRAETILLDHGTSRGTQTDKDRVLLVNDRARVLHLFVEWRRFAGAEWSHLLEGKNYDLHYCGLSNVFVVTRRTHYEALVRELPYAYTEDDGSTDALIEIANQIEE